MRDIVKYILESREDAEKIHPTDEWLVEHYNMFNKMYFNNELPKPGDVRLEVRRMSKDNCLGCQGEYERYYISSDHMRNGMYVMYTLPNRRTPLQYKSVYKGKRCTWEPIVDNLHEVKSIVELIPFIRLNGIYVSTVNNLEDTLIHEMVHLWTFKDGLAPKQAHGKEFKRKCAEIRKIAAEKYGKKYELSKFAINSDEYSYDEKRNAVLQAQIDKAMSIGGGVVGVYLELDEEGMKKEGYTIPNRFFFCTNNMLKKLLHEIKTYSVEANYIKHIYISNSYAEMCKAYAEFKVMRTYRYYDAAQYSKSKALMRDAGKDVFTTNVNEAKKPYIKPVTTIYVVPEETNLSEINIEDLIKAQEEMNHNITSDANDKKIIDGKLK